MITKPKNMAAASLKLPQFRPKKVADKKKYKRARDKWARSF